MAFAADFNIALNDRLLRAFDLLYKLTLGRNLPITKPSSFNNTFLLGDDTTRYQPEDPNTFVTYDWYNKNFFTTDVAIPNAETLYAIFMGDIPGQLNTVWGFTTGWYFAAVDTIFGNPNVSNIIPAFSASNPDVDWPWNVKEWIPMPEYTAFKAPTAAPIFITPPTVINRFKGLSGWAIQTTAGVLVASAAQDTKFENPWNPIITQWVDVNTGITYNVGGGRIIDNLTITQNREVSAWYWQYGSSLANAYSAESIEQYPWNVPYSLWHPVPGAPYFNIAPPQIIRMIDTPLIVEPKNDNSYLGSFPKISEVNNGSLLKRNDGLLGFKISNQEPYFSYPLGPLNTENDWYMVGLSLSGRQAKLFKNLNFHTFNNLTGSFELSSIALGGSNVDIGQVLIYSKALTEKEYIQTYRNFKGRYLKDEQPSGRLSEAIDGDALKYITKSNITSIEGQQQLSRFCSELKVANLWNNVTFWPLRQNQMTQSGNIVYSLGGLGEFIGTIIGGSTRSNNGLLLNPSQRIQTNFQGATAEEPRSMFVVVRDASQSGFLCGEGNAAFGQSFAIKFNSNRVFLDHFQGDPPLYTATTLRNRASGVSQINQSFTVWTPVSNQSSTTAQNQNTTQGPFFINQGNIQYNAERNNNHYAIVLRSNIRLSVTQFSKIYDIYKRTLGEGLGLA
jgi:hypothetical protein